MNKKLLPTLIGLCIALGMQSYAFGATEEKVDELKSFKVSNFHEVACNRIGSLYTKSHYKEVEFDENFEKNIFERYYQLIDYNRNLLTASEVEEIRANSNKLVSAVKGCSLQYVFDLYFKVSKRKLEKEQYIISSIDTKKFDLTTNDEIIIDTSKMAPAKDINELHEMWDKSLVNEYLSLVLSGKDDKTAKLFLKKRHNNKIKNIYKTKDEDAFSAIENAYSRALDPHTSYLSPKDTSEFDDSMSLSMEGIGAVLTQREDYVEIVSLSPGSPAELCGKLKPKDKIIGVAQHNDKKQEPMVDVIGMRLVDVVPMVRGKKGSTVTLQIQRGDGATSTVFNVDIIRDKINLEESAAKGEVVEVKGKKVGVLTIKSFYNNLSADIKKELNKLNEAQVDAVVIDLRYNGGGSLFEANLSTGLFFKSNPVVQIRDALGNVSKLEDNDDVSSYTGPLVVLINRFSASASEIMAAALQDTGRAIIVGSKSFGKGTVQQARPLAKMYDYFDMPLGSVHFTISKFYRVNGGSTQLRGVSPDIDFPALVDFAEAGEENEPNALVWDQVKPAKYSVDNSTKAVLPELAKRHVERVSQDPYFIDLQKSIEQYKTLVSSNTMSLNLEKRKKDKDEADLLELNRVNMNLKDQGKATIKDLKELPDDFKAKDVYLEEAEIIALDLAEMLKK